MIEKPYASIKELVFEIIHKTKGLVDYTTLTREIKKYFPKSKWQKTHWVWYRSQIKNGRFKNLFSETERKNLTGDKNTGKATELNLKKYENSSEKNKVKHIGDTILSHVRFIIKETTNDNYDSGFNS